MITPQSIQNVMQRADLLEVAEQFIKLKKRGTNYIGNCPFHNEKTPSFVLSPAKGIYKCFGCGKGGNVVTFLQEHEKYSYPEAIKWLAQFYHISIEETHSVNPERIEAFKKEEALRILNEAAAKWFHETLKNNEQGQMVGLSYLKHRGISSKIIDDFQLGYCPDTGNAFATYAIQAGYNEDLLIESGLCKKSYDKLVDNYRGRIIFPIHAVSGKIVGFGARIIVSNTNAPKYINTPENDLYHKSKILYGMYQGRTSIAKLDECILTEGYTDVLALHQAGLNNVVASGGTSLTADQLRLISHQTKQLTILYDGDNAGIKAALRGLDLALEAGFRVNILMLPDGHDPDSYLQANDGEHLKSFIANHKQDAIAFLIERGKALENDPREKSVFVNELAQTISKINKAEDFTLQQYYISSVAQQLHINESAFINLVNKHIRQHVDKLVQKQTATPITNAIDVPDIHTSEQKGVIEKYNYEVDQEWQLIKVLITLGEQPYSEEELVAQHIRDRVDIDSIESDAVRSLFELYFQYVDAYGTLPGVKYFVQHPNEDIQQQLSALLHDRYEVSPNWKIKLGIDPFHDDRHFVQEIESTMAYYDLKKVKSMQHDILDRLKTTTDPKMVPALQAKFLEFKVMEKEILKLMGPAIINFLNKK